MKPQHTRVTWEGHRGSSSSNVIERWSFSINSPDSVTISAATQAQLNTYADQAFDAFRDQVFEARFDTNTWLTKCTIAVVQPDGTYLTRTDGSYVKGEHSNPSSGTQADQGMPLQIALCVSLNTARSGPTGKGRFFLPWPSLAITAADRLVSVANMEPFAADVAEFLGSYNDIAGLNAAVVSSKGYSSDVTSIRIGRAPDTLRSRREELPEGYVSVTVPQ